MERETRRSSRARRGNGASMVTLRTLALGATMAAVATSTARADADGCDLYVQPPGQSNGADEHLDGSFRRPYESLEEAQLAMQPGTTLCVLSGTYQLNIFVVGEILTRAEIQTHRTTIRGHRVDEEEDFPRFVFDGGVAFDFRGAEYLTFENIEVRRGARSLSKADVAGVVAKR